MEPDVAAGKVTNLTAFSVEAAAVIVIVPYLVLVIASTTVVVAFKEVTVLALSTVSANGSG